MPVSKKRIKDGKPAKRAAPPPVDQGEQDHGPANKPGAPAQRMGKPSNPFVAQMPRRAA